MDNEYRLSEPATRNDAGGTGRHLTKVHLQQAMYGGYVSIAYAYRWSMDTRWCVPDIAASTYTWLDTQAEAEAELIRRFAS